VRGRGRRAERYKKRKAFLHVKRKVLVVNMPVTLEMIHREMQQLKSEIHLLRDMMEGEWKLSDATRRELRKAREEMAQGEYVRHDDVVAKYG
jgi:hypothetical protein